MPINIDTLRTYTHGPLTMRVIKDASDALISIMTWLFWINGHFDLFGAIHHRMSQGGCIDLTSSQEDSIHVAVVTVGILLGIDDPEDAEKLVSNSVNRKILEDAVSVLDSFIEDFL